TVAFERFVVEDALHDRELLRGVDHRLASVLDRLVMAAIAGEVRAAPASQPVSRPALEAHPDGAPSAGPPTSKKPTVAAPEAIVRFADALLDAPMFATVTFDSPQQERRML